jgi:hypothetical protein
VARQFKLSPAIKAVFFVINGNARNNFIDILRVGLDPEYTKYEECISTSYKWLKKRLPEIDGDTANDEGTDKLLLSFIIRGKAFNGDTLTGLKVSNRTLVGEHSRPTRPRENMIRCTSRSSPKKSRHRLT